MPTSASRPSRSRACVERPGHASGAQLVDVAADRLCPAAHGGVVAADAHHLCRGVDEGRRVTAVLPARLVDPFEEPTGGLHRRERGVELRRIARSELRASAASRYRPMMSGTPPSCIGVTSPGLPRTG